MTELRETPTNDTQSSAPRAAAEQASELGTTVREQAGEVAATAREHVSDVVGTARNDGREVIDRTRHAVEVEARQRTDELARSVRRFGDGLVALADGRPDEAGPVRNYARDAATRVDGLAQRLESRGYDGLVDDVSTFARRRPGVFLASSALLGFAVGRIIRSGGASSGSSSSPSSSSGSSPQQSIGAPPQNMED